jgi:multiple sugar transport system substrate-binding protein
MSEDNSIFPTKDVSRRQFLTGAAAAVAALSLPANRQLRQLVHLAPAKNAPADDVLTVALYASASFAKIAAKYMANFTKLSGIKVNVIGIPGNSWVQVFEDVSTRIAGGQAVDSTWIPTEGMLLFTERGALEPLDSYIAADKAIVDAYYKDLDPHLLADFRGLDNVNGHTYELPVGYNVMSMWINKPVFKEYNVPIPEPDWTWADFEKIATKLSAPPNRYGFYLTPVPGPFTDVYPWVLTAGGQILNAAQTKCVANQPASIEAATFARRLVQKNLVNAPGGSYN